MPWRPLPIKPVPEPPLPYGVEGPAGRDEPEERAKRQDRTYVKLPPTNVHGRLMTGSWPQYQLRSSSETAYPTLFSPAGGEFWHGLSEEQQLEVTRMQAAAMERVGFEPGTKKYFIDAEEDATDLYIVLGCDKPVAEEKIHELEGGARWVFGGMLIGAGAAAIALALSPLISPEQPGLDNTCAWGGALGVMLGSVVAMLKVEGKKN